MYEHRINMLIVVLIVAMCIGGCVGCGGGGDAAAAGGGGGAAGLPRVEVRIVNSDEQVFVVEAEVASTYEQRELGLMHRASLGEYEGMLFVFDGEAYRSFWMKNTLIELDMIFADADKAIVDIRRKAQPGDETPYTSGAPAKYVLEVNGGFCEARNIHPGDRLEFGGY